MGKLTTYLIFISVLIILYNLFGLIADTPISILLSLLTNPQNIRTSTFYQLTLATITLISTVGIIIGTFLAQKTELIVRGGIASFMILVGWDMVVFFNTLNNINSALAVLLVSPLIITYVLVVVEWLTGID